MKQVIAIYHKGVFKQYLLKKEVRHLIHFCTGYGELTIKLVEITKEDYKLHFGM